MKRAAIYARDPPFCHCHAFPFRFLQLVTVLVSSIHAAGIPNRTKQYFVIHLFLFYFSKTTCLVNVRNNWQVENQTHLLGLSLSE
jgi:hypothetical protein